MTVQKGINRIALVQSALVWGKVNDNLERFSQKLEKRLDCDIILLPEMFPCGCTMVKKAPEAARREKEQVAAEYQRIQAFLLEWAAFQGAVVMGSTVYEEEGKYYNRLIAAFPDGRCATYDKRHCFRMGGENEHFTPGNRQVILEIAGMKVAVFICYDLRFPVWSRNTAGYDLAVYVANWPASRREVWKTLLRARAIENQAFVAAVNCVGEDANGLLYAGDSMVVNACGEVTGACREYEEELLQVEISLEELIRFREKFSVLEDADRFFIR